METKDKILAYKYFQPKEKLVLYIIQDECVDVEPFSYPCRLRTNEIGLRIGLSRKDVLDCIWGLLENDLIETNVENYSRDTKLSKRCLRLINKKD